MKVQGNGEGLPNQASAGRFFQRKFAVTSVMKIYTKMCELCVHPDYDHFYIQLTLK